MTTMMTDSQFGLGDMEALLWETSCPMADPAGPPPAHPRSDRAEAQPHGPEGPLSFFFASSSPPSSFSSLSLSPSASFSSPPSSSSSPPSSSSSSLSSSASPPPFYSPPASPPPPPSSSSLLLHGDKAGLEPDVLSLPWLAPPTRLGRVGSEVASGKGDTFCDLDWMTERMDLSEFDLDSLIGTCSPNDDAPSSPEDLLASLDCPLALDSLPDLPPSPPPPQHPPSAPLSPLSPVVPTSPDVEMLPPHDEAQWEPASPPPCVPDPQSELEIKSEPDSPEPSPAYTMDLGSEVDVVDSELKECKVKPVVVVVVPAPVPAVTPQVPRILLSLSPTRIVLLLTPKDKVTTPTTTSIPAVNHPSPRGASTTSSRPHRSRPYPDPSLQSPCTSGVGKVRSTRESSGEVDGGGGGSSSSSSSSSGNSSSSSSSSSGTGNSRSSRVHKDKKLKKMEQNKTAATRYRQKKRVEHMSLSSEYADLERKNIELTEKAESMAREIQYLKELMEEVRTTRLGKGLGVDL